MTDPHRKQCKPRKGGTSTQAPETDDAPARPAKAQGQTKKVKSDE